MKVLLDHCVPRGFRRFLVGHDVKTTDDQGWARLANGSLLKAAAPTFGAFISVDKNLWRKQNRGKLPLPVIVIDSLDNQIPTLAAAVPEVQKLLNSRLQRKVYFVTIR